MITRYSPPPLRQLPSPSLRLPCGKKGWPRRVFSDPKSFLFITYEKDSQSRGGGRDRYKWLSLIFCIFRHFPNFGPWAILYLPANFFPLSAFSPSILCLAAWLARHRALLHRIFCWKNKPCLRWKKMSSSLSRTTKGSANGGKLARSSLDFEPAGFYPLRIELAQSHSLAISALTEPDHQNIRRKKGFRARKSQLEIVNRPQIILLSVIILIAMVLQYGGGPGSRQFSDFCVLFSRTTPKTAPKHQAIEGAPWSGNRELRGWPRGAVETGVKWSLKKAHNRELEAKIAHKPWIREG